MKLIYTTVTSASSKSIALGTSIPNIYGLLYKSSWYKIERAAQDARFEMDNNLIENKIRPLALGRKNYLFAGSHDGAVRAAMMYSFFGTCKAKGINPYDWLVDTLNKIPSHPINRIQDLLPGYIQINDV